MPSRLPWSNLPKSCVLLGSEASILDSLSDQRTPYRYREEMKANQAYFYRNRGPWNWRVQFDFESWSVLWKAEISFFSKACLSVLAIVHRFLDPLQMWTCVGFQESSDLVRHSTKMKKCGLTIYRSEKTFILDKNGTDIRLEGKEYYWPLSFIGFPFVPTVGLVDASTTRASYQMPIAGAQCNCHAFLELPVGHIDITAPWIRGRFSLTDASNKTLQDRFEQG